MKKKILAQIIAFVMIFSCFSVFNPMQISAASNVTVSMQTIRELIPKLEQKFESISVADRSKLFHIGIVYLQTDMGIETLISAIDNPSSSFPDELDPFINFINENATYKDQCILGLLFIKSIPETARKKAIENFTNREAYTPLTADEKDSLYKVCQDLLGSNLLSVLESDHNVTPEILLNLVSCLKGTFVLTDNKYGGSDLALSSIESSTFSSNLSHNVSSRYSAINSHSIKSTDSIINAILDVMNQSFSTTLKSKYKILAGSLDMYISVSKGGGGGGGGGSTPSPTSPPIIIPPTVTPTPIPATPKPIPAPTLSDPELAGLGVFSDMETHWSRPYVGKLLEIGIFKGYPDNTFKPDNDMSREEVAVVMVRALGWEDELTDAPTSFSDQENISSWAKGYIALLTEKGIIHGYGDGTFRPKEPISRAEMMCMISSALGEKPQMSDLNFKDKDQIPEWAYTSIKNAYNQSIITGYEDNTFRPGEMVKRSVAATLMYNYMYTQNRGALDLMP